MLRAERYLVVRPKPKIFDKDLVDLKHQPGKENLNKKELIREITVVIPRGRDWLTRPIQDGEIQAISSAAQKFHLRPDQLQVTVAKAEKNGEVKRHTIIPKRRWVKRVEQLPQPISPEEVARFSTAEGRVQRLYDRFFPGQFVVTDKGLHFKQLSETISPKHIADWMGFHAKELREHPMQTVARAEDAISYYFVRLIAGDPLMLVKEKEAKGLHPKKDGFQARGMIKDALHFATYKEKPAHHVGTIGRARSWLPTIHYKGLHGKNHRLSIDALFDIPGLVGTSLNALIHGRRINAPAVYGAALFLDTREFPTPGIDGPSIKPYLQLNEWAHAIAFTQHMRNSLLTQPTTEAQQENADTYYKQLRTLMKTHAYEFSNMEKTSRKLVELGTGRKVGKNETTLIPSVESILQMSALDPQEQDMLIVARQVRESMIAVEERAKAEKSNKLFPKLLRRLKREKSPTQAQPSNEQNVPDSPAHVQLPLQSAVPEFPNEYKHGDDDNDE